MLHGRFVIICIAFVSLHRCNGFIHRSPKIGAEGYSMTMNKIQIDQRHLAIQLSMAGNVKDISETSFEMPDDDDDNNSPYVKRAGISSSELRLTNEMTETRKARLEQEVSQSKSFVSGDALHILRQKVLGLRRKLQEARERGDKVRRNRVTRTILRAQQMDAEFIYQVSLERMEAATNAGLKDEAETYRKEAMLARSSLPQFNMEGLWIGRFRDDFQMVNISYVGDLLVARKVTGNKNVPKGEISFTVDLSPKIFNDALEPLELNDESARQWGRKFLQRFPGKGQVASPGYQDREWMEGQLIVVDKYFSFAWLPIAHQVFFGRPSPELTLKMLRESRVPALPTNVESMPSSIVVENDVETMRAHVSRCWEETEYIQDELDVSDGVFKSHEQSFYYEQEGCFE